MDKPLLVTIKCSNCGNDLPSSWVSEVDCNKTKCPKCGETARSISITASTSLQLRDNILAKLKGAKKVGKKKYLKEMSIGWVPSELADGMVYKEWEVDRAADPKWYYERITDKDGNIIHEKNHALGDHKGHGSDKFNKVKKMNPIKVDHNIFLFYPDKILPLVYFTEMNIARYRPMILGITMTVH